MLCSVAMPTDYEVPAFHRPAPVRRPASLNLAVSIQAPGAPRRPILVVRPGPAPEDEQPVVEQQELQLQAPVEQLTSPTKNKKRVVFADDAGRQLTHVKVMTEPSFAPPRWSMAFLAQVTRGAAAEVCPEPWEPTFPQPASDYLAFRAKLDRENVSLENVIVREAEQVVVGTVKVRNLAFHKEVLVRSTSDDWATHEDAYCTYVNNGPSASAAGVSVPVLYDTFSFRLALPPQSRKLEFCVRFRAEGHSQEYWDSNAGNNYVLLRKNSPYNPLPQPANQFTNSTVDELTSKIGGLAVNHIRPMSPPRQSDISYAKPDSWSEFASWNHLSMDGPYCWWKA
ncbi:Protein phosphatase 1 regulatory subunit 3B-B [Frankliniella fusca]|uniref:Protein phosphatase 1 regulatory subunit 3B-B n=1 Tax=Frankliniella fusca TaxID=407009 RepID=A0AAE1HQ39_9NEOP|nr:Protein phosphatase 1 regulatory subunit 3B-B [Frankliniella fusca]